MYSCNRLVHLVYTPVAIPRISDHHSKQAILALHHVYRQANRHVKEVGQVLQTVAEFKVAVRVHLGVGRHQELEVERRELEPCEVDFEFDFDETQVVHYVVVACDFDVD